MSKSFKTKEKTREQYIEDVLVELKKNLANFQLTAQKRDKTIQEYIRLLNLTNSKNQKLFEENKILKEKIEAFEKEKNIKRQKIKKKKTI